MELRQGGAVWRAEALEERAGLGNRLRDDFADGLVAAVLREGCAAIGNEPVEFEHERLLTIGASISGPAARANMHETVRHHRGRCRAALSPVDQLLGWRPVNSSRTRLAKLS